VANPYAYVMNSPLNGTDPTGQQCTDSSCFKGGVAPNAYFATEPSVTGFGRTGMVSSGPGEVSATEMSWYRWVIGHEVGGMPNDPSVDTIVVVQVHETLAPILCILCVAVR